MTYLKLIAGAYPGIRINLDHITAIVAARDEGGTQIPAEIWLASGERLDLTPDQYNKLSALKFGYSEISV